MQLLGAWRHQAITWTNVDMISMGLCGQMKTILHVMYKVLSSEMNVKVIYLRLLLSSLGYNELNK